MGIVVANFSEGCMKTYTKTLFQHDKGQRLKFEGVEYPDKSEVHFSNTEKDGVSFAVTIVDDTVKIPDTFLATGEYVYAWLYARRKSDGSKGDIDYHLDDVVNDVDDDERLVIDKVEASKKGFDDSMSLFEVVIPVQKRPDVIRVEDITDSKGGEDAPMEPQITINDEDMQITGTGNDGTGASSLQNYTVEGENFIFMPKN